MVSGQNAFQASHPPHLTSTWSSALIPFCAYKTDLDMSKNTPFLSGLTYPICSSFLPTLLEGQFCYQLTLNMTSGQGKRNALALLVDYNDDLSLQVTHTKDEISKSSKKTLNFERVKERRQSASAKIHIDTLTPFVSYGGGLYSMTDVKRMTAKEDFLKMSLEDRKCEVELYEDCRTRKLLEECGCVPWELPRDKVKIHMTQSIKEAKICDAMGRDCVEKKSTSSFDCLPSCVGIYADTAHWKDGDGDIANEEIEPLISEYRKFKLNNVKHFRFNSSATSNQFGEFISV